MSVSNRERYRKFIDVLHRENVGKFINLPQIAVMGDTSTGKSSLLTAVSGIEFPSNDQLTTRCPARVRLEKSDLAQVKVSIQWTAAGNNPEWAPQIFTPEQAMDISKAIGDAQDCIIQTSNSGSRGCASDIIEIEVYGPSCVNLTLIDLPGIVRSVGDGDSESLIDEIRTLINHYLNNPRCIILAVLPGNVDYHNSGILTDAKKVDPDGERTIPVITKADSIDSGGERSVLNLLLGKEISCKLGFHMTKCRGQQQLNKGVTLERSLVKELEFFATKEPWSLQENRSLFGVENLKEKLASVQVKMIEDSMPGILAQIALVKVQAQRDLEALGEEMSSPGVQRNAYERSKERLVSSLQEVYDGAESDMKLKMDLSDTDGYTWCTQMQQEIRRFGDNILQQKLGNITKQVHVGMSVSVQFDDGHDDVQGTAVAVSQGGHVCVMPNADGEDLCFQSKSQPLQTQSPQTEWQVGQFVTENGRDYFAIIEKLDGTGLNFTVNHFINFPVGNVRPNLSWLRERLDRSQTNELSCFLNVRVFNQILLELIEFDIKPACLAFLESMSESLQTLIKNAVDSSYPVLFPRVKYLTTQQLTALAKAVYEKQLDQVIQAMQRESKPFTQNQDLYQEIERKRNERLQMKIKGAMKNANDPVGRLIVLDAIFAQQKRMSMDEHKLHEMEVILDAYGKVASKRIIDEVPMIAKALFQEFIRGCRKEISATDAQLAQVMSESSDVMAKRADYKSKLEAIHNAENAVREFNLGQ